jgi:hypothetical protein
MGDEGVKPWSRLSRLRPETDPLSFERFDLKLVAVFLLLISCSFRFAYAFDFLPPFVFKHRQCFNFPRVHYPNIGAAEAFPYLKLFDKSQAFRCDQRFGALCRENASPGPDWPLRWSFLRERAMPHLNQAAFPAVVAVPCGLVRKLKLERDN